MKIAMENWSDATLKMWSVGLTTATVALGLLTVAVGWMNTSVRAESGRRSETRNAETSALAAAANLEAGQASERAAVADQRAAEANEHSTALELTLEKERIERLRLEARLAPRHLTAAQRTALVAAIQPYRGQVVEVVAMLGDGESEDFAREFVPLFRQAGWVLLGPQDVTLAVIAPNPVGIQVSYNQSVVAAGGLPGATLPLLDALIASGLVTVRTVFVVPDLPGDRITFRVGRKPE